MYSVYDILGLGKGAMLGSVLVGPAGVHYDLFYYGDGEPVVRILSDAGVVVRSRERKVLLKTSDYPPFSCQESVSKLLVGRKITALTDAASPGNVLRLVLDDSFVLLLRPGRWPDGVAWSVYHSTPDTDGRRKTVAFTVFSDVIEFFA